MAKKENGNATKSFILRVEAPYRKESCTRLSEPTMNFGVQTARYNTFWIKPYARQGASKRNEY